MLAIQNSASRINVQMFPMSPFASLIDSCLSFLHLGNSYLAQRVCSDTTPSVLASLTSTLLRAEQPKHTRGTACIHTQTRAPQGKGPCPHVCTPKSGQFLVPSIWAPELTWFLHCSPFYVKIAMCSILWIYHITWHLQYPCPFSVNAGKFWAKGASQSL